jgi:hypothetical protein
MSDNFLDEFLAQGESFWGYTGEETERREVLLVQRRGRCW